MYLKYFISVAVTTEHTAKFKAVPATSSLYAAKYVTALGAKLAENVAEYGCLTPALESGYVTPAPNTEYVLPEHDTEYVAPAPETECVLPAS